MEGCLGGEATCSSGPSEITEEVLGVIESVFIVCDVIERVLSSWSLKSFFLFKLPVEVPLFTCYRAVIQDMEVFVTMFSPFYLIRIG